MVGASDLVFAGISIIICSYTNVLYCFRIPSYMKQIQNHKSDELYANRCNENCQPESKAVIQMLKFSKLSTF